MTTTEREALVATALSLSMQAQALSKQVAAVQHMTDAVLRLLAGEAAPAAPPARPKRRSFGDGESPRRDPDDGGPS